MEPQQQQPNSLAKHRPGDAAKVPENFKFCAKTKLFTERNFLRLNSVVIGTKQSR